MAKKISKIKHTPLPWKIWDRGTKLNPSHVIEGSGKLILQTIGGEDKGNAEFVLQACNSFHERRRLIKDLLQVCKDIEDWLRENTKATNRPARLDQKLQQIIARAKKEI